MSKTENTRLAEAFARRVLLECWGPLDKDELPIDPIQIATFVGIDVYAKELDVLVDGMIVKKPGKNAEIFLNNERSIPRQRFTCAHELGHFMQNTKKKSIEYVDYRNMLSAAGSNPEEIFANAFAASLLMPGELVTEFHAEGLTADDMAELFYVLTSAMKYRLINAGLEENSRSPEYAY